MKLKYKLKSIYLILFSSAYYVISNKGSSFELPRHRGLLEALQEELEQVDNWVEELVTEMILEERDIIE